MTELQPLLPASPADTSVIEPEAIGDAGGFGSALKSAIQSVDKLQVSADTESQKVALGSGNLHETAIALDEADISMRLMTTVRNKVVNAYQDVMKMSV
jgi:flagellar hook-basal body complex protein FliE